MLFEPWVHTPCCLCPIMWYLRAVRQHWCSSSFHPPPPSLSPSSLACVAPRFPWPIADQSPFEGAERVRGWYWFDDMCLQNVHFLCDETACDRQCRLHQLTLSPGAVLPTPLLFLSFNVTPSSPAESIISDYVSVKVFSAGLSPTVASSCSPSLYGPEARQQPHYADPQSEHRCCRGTALQTALSLTFLLNSALTTQGEFIMPDKTPPCKISSVRKLHSD